MTVHRLRVSRHCRRLAVTASGHDELFKTTSIKAFCLREALSQEQGRRAWKFSVQSGRRRCVKRRTLLAFTSFWTFVALLVKEKQILR